MAHRGQNLLCLDSFLVLRPRGRGTQEAIGGQVSGDDALDVPLEDANLAEEIQLLSELILLGSQADGAIEQSSIDDVLRR